jgi:hypothetical protein
MNRFELIRMILGQLGINPERFAVKWVSAAEGIRFVQVISQFTGTIRDLGQLGQKEGIDFNALRYKIRAALRAVNERTLRMVFAKQAKQIKDDNTYGEFPSGEKLEATFVREKTLYETLLYLEEKTRTASELAGLLKIPEDEVLLYVDMLKKKNIWDGELCKT